jgi:hypothetical protein
MGVLSDFYISTPERALAYDDESLDWPEDDRAQFKGLTPLECSTLWCILQGIPWDVQLMDEFECLLEPGDGERFIHRLPTNFIYILASLDASKIAAASEQWAATEEIACAPDEIRSVIEELARLAKAAEGSNRSVYVWNCL